MRFKLLIFCILLVAGKSVFAQRVEKKYINANELKLINDLSSTIKDTSIIFSPYIYCIVESKYIDKQNLIKNYGFDKSQFKDNTNDTLLIKENLYFKVINTDTLSKYKLCKLDVIILGDPILFLIEKNYKKDCLLNFYKPIISKNNKYAIVQYFIHCGGLSGWGEIDLMEWTNHKWIKVKTLMISES